MRLVRLSTAFALLLSPALLLAQRVDRESDAEWLEKCRDNRSRGNDERGRRRLFRASAGVAWGGRRIRVLPARRRSTDLLVPKTAPGERSRLREAAGRLT